MSAQPSSSVHGRRARGPRWPLVLVLVVLVLAVAVAQFVSFVPVDPTRGTLQNDQPLLLWVAGDYGSSTDHINGVRTVNGTTLILNDLYSPTNASATWSISFPEAYDAPGHTIDYTFWLPATMAFSRNDTPLQVTVDGRAFAYQPSHPQNVTFQQAPIYVPDPNDTEHLPGLFNGFLGGGLYVPLASSSASVNATVVVVLTVPAGAQVTLPHIVFSAAPAPSTAAASGMVEERGWVMLPVLAVGVAGVAWAFRRLWVAEVAGVVALGLGIRLAVAPIFLHTDLVTLTQYPVLLYSYGIVNQQSFIYGPTWFLSLLAPAAPLYAAGLTPSTNAFNVLFKLTPIAFDGLTFLVLLRLLKKHLDERTAYRWATFGWLLNPFVIYFSAVHGLDESAIAFFVVLAIYAAGERRWVRSAISEALAVLTLYPAAFALPPLLALKRRPLWFVGMAIILPLLVLAILLLALYQSVSPAIAYFGVVAGGASTSNLPTYGSLASAQTPWFILTRGFSLTPSPLVGLAVVAVAFLVLVIVRRPVAGETLPAAVALALFGFYLSYQSFFVQLLVWLVPVLVVLLAVGPRPARRGLEFLLGIGLLAIAINLSAPWCPYQDAVASLVLFSFLAAPLLILLKVPSTRLLERVATVLTAAAFVLALLLTALSALVHPFSIAMVTLAAVATVCLGIPVLLADNPPAWTRKELVPLLLTVVTTGASLGFLYADSPQWGTAANAVILATALLVVLYCLCRFTWSTHLWLRTDA